MILIQVGSLFWIFTKQKHAGNMIQHSRIHTCAVCTISETDPASSPPTWGGVLLSYLTGVGHLFLIFQAVIFSSWSTVELTSCIFDSLQPSPFSSLLGRTPSPFASERQWPGVGHAGNSKPNLRHIVHCLNTDQGGKKWWNIIWELCFRKNWLI